MGWHTKENVYGDFLDMKQKGNMIQCDFLLLFDLCFCYRRSVDIFAKTERIYLCIMYTMDILCYVLLLESRKVIGNGIYRSTERFKFEIYG